MKSRLDMLLQFLAFYSWVFILLTIYYEINGYPSGVMIIPFEEAGVFMVVVALYILHALVKGRLTKEVFRFSLILLLTTVALVVLAVSFRLELILILGALIFGIPAMPAIMLTSYMNYGLETWLFLTLAVCIIVWSYIRTQKQSRIANSVHL